MLSYNYSNTVRWCGNGNAWCSYVHGELNDIYEIPISTQFRLFSTLHLKPLHCLVIIIINFLCAIRLSAFYELRHTFSPTFFLWCHFSMQIWWWRVQNERHSFPVPAHDNDVGDVHVPPQSSVMVFVQNAAQGIHIEWRVQKRRAQCGVRASNAGANTNT